MSFAAPLFLLGLAVLPVLAVLYVLHGRGRAGREQQWANPALMPGVVTARPGWRRHAPIALYGLALASLLTALARPQASVAVPVERASVVLATDVSGSMQATDLQPNRLEAARAAGRRLVDSAPRRLRLGLVAFNQDARVLQAPTADRAEVLAALDNLRSSGGTATGEAISASLLALRRADGERRPAPGAIVLLSDGASTAGRDPLEAAAEARRLRVPIYTIALGTPTGTIQAPGAGGQGTVTREVPPDPASLARVAEISGGRTFSVEDAGELEDVYEQLGSQVSTREERREVTAGFAGGALALLGLGALLSLRFFGRLP